MKKILTRTLCVMALTAVAGSFAEHALSHSEVVAIQNRCGYTLVSHYPEITTITRPEKIIEDCVTKVVSLKNKQAVMQENLENARSNWIIHECTYIQQELGNLTRKCKDIQTDIDKFRADLEYLQQRERDTQTKARNAIKRGLIRMGRV